MKLGSALTSAAIIFLIGAIVQHIWTWIYDFIVNPNPVIMIVTFIVAIFVFWNEI